MLNDAVNSAAFSASGFTITNTFPAEGHVTQKLTEECKPRIYRSGLQNYPWKCDVAYYKLKN